MLLYARGVPLTFITSLDTGHTENVYSHAMYRYFPNLDIEGKDEVVSVLN
jgi:hypothetical protein